jgi:hypothetical protein
MSLMLSFVTMVEMRLYQMIGYSERTWEDFLA